MVFRSCKNEKSKTFSYFTSALTSYLLMSFVSKKYFSSVCFYIYYVLKFKTIFQSVILIQNTNTKQPRYAFSWDWKIWRDVLWIFSPVKLRRRKRGEIAVMLPGGWNILPRKLHPFSLPKYQGKQIQWKPVEIFPLPSAKFVSSQKADII